MPDLSPEAKERARRTIAVSQVIAEHADEIAEATGTVPEGHVLVAAGRTATTSSPACTGSASPT